MSDAPARSRFLLRARASPSVCSPDGLGMPLGLGRDVADAKPLHGKGVIRRGQGSRRSEWALSCGIKARQGEWQHG
jgi:hypothetical protein